MVDRSQLIENKLLHKLICCRKSQPVEPDFSHKLICRIRSQLVERDPSYKLIRRKKSQLVEHNLFYKLICGRYSHSLCLAGLDLVDFLGYARFEFADIDIVLDIKEVTIGNTKVLAEAQGGVSGNFAPVVQNILNSGYRNMDILRETIGR